MRGDVVGGDVIRLGAVPVGRLALNDREARGFKGGLRAVAAVLTGNRAGLALDDGDFAGAADLLDQVFRAEFADRDVVGGDIGVAGAPSSASASILTFSSMSTILMPLEVASAIALFRFTSEIGATPIAL